MAAPPPSSFSPATPTLAQPSHQLDPPSYLVDAADGGRPVQEPAQPLLDCDSSYLRGDFNRVNGRDEVDAVILMNCVFLDPEGYFCLTCIGDMNCDRRFSPTDVAIFLILFYTAPEQQIRCPPDRAETNGN